MNIPALYGCSRGNRYSLSRLLWHLLPYDKDKSDLESKIESLQAGPKFTGHFYQFRILTATPTEALVASEDYVGEFHVFVEAYIVNKVDHSGNIVDLDFMLEVGGALRRLERNPSFEGWAMEDDRAITDLGRLLGSHVFERGHGQEGWLHFVLRDTPISEMQRKEPRDCVLLLTDGLTKEHKLSQKLVDLSVPRPGIMWARQRHVL
jgi:hypothetical protein